MLDPSEIQDGDSVLVNHPSVGSVWLHDVEVIHYENEHVKDRVYGVVEDRSVPEGESPMHFAVTCAWKRRGKGD